MIVFSFERKEWIRKQMSKKESKNKKSNIKNKKTKKKHKGLKNFLKIVLLIAIVIAGFVGYSAYKNGWGIKGMVQTAMGQDERKLADLDPFTVLLLGVS